MRSAFALRMFSGNAIYNFVVPERLRTLRYYIFTVGVVKENYILCHHPYEHCAAGRFSLQNPLDYAILDLPLQKRQVLSALQVVSSLPAEMSGESYLLFSSGRFECFTTGYPKEEFHHGSFEYCFQCTEPSGHSHYRCHSVDMDDLAGCLWGQAARKALFSQQKVTTAPAYQF